MLRSEQETVINFNAEATEAYVYSADPVIMRRLDRLVESNPDHYKMVKEWYVAGEVIAKDYIVSNKRLVKFAKPVQYTEEQLAELKARGRALYEMQQNKKAAEQTQTAEEG